MNMRKVIREGSAEEGRSLLRTGGIQGISQGNTQGKKNPRNRTECAETNLASFQQS